MEPESDPLLTRDGRWFAPTDQDLPCEDGRICDSFEVPQSQLLSGVAFSRLEQLHPDGDFFMGADTGIYWYLGDTVEECRYVSPDWYYIPGAAPMPPGRCRRSYVVWRERALPYLVIEYLSTTDSGELDRTPGIGKFWVYEQALAVPYYVLYDYRAPSLGAYRQANGARRYEPIEPNERGHFWIPQMGMELGLWEGKHFRCHSTWLRWWDSEGNVIPTPAEEATRWSQLADKHHQRDDDERDRADQ